MRHGIWVYSLAVALVLAFTASPAYAWHCPKLAADAKAVIAKAEMKGGDAAAIAKAKALVADGEADHAAGRHNAAVEKLAESIETAVHSVTHKHGGMSKKKGYSW